MPSSAATSDTGVNPLIAIKQHEQTEMQRVEKVKQEIDRKEAAAMEVMEKEAAKKEQTYKEAAQADLKTFAQKEPAEILKRGQQETDNELHKIDAAFSSKKGGLVQGLVRDFLSSHSV
jgi:phage terminase small subunit